MYDAIVVGARCAGSATALLLSRQGYRVLLVDRASFPSDTISTHWLHEPAVAYLQEWGLLDRVLATGCPPIRSIRFDLGPLVLEGRPFPSGDVDFALCVRRTVLDKILVDAAVAAGAELREGFSVAELLWDEGRVVGIRGGERGVEESAPFVIGADGQNSFVADAVGADAYNEVPPGEVIYYAYWRDLPVDGMEIYAREGSGGAVLPTNDDETLVIVGWAHDQLDVVRRDLERSFVTTASSWSADLEARLSQATRVGQIKGKADLRGFYRKPYGPGWALVGDAGYHKDPITAQGITDAFRDATALAEAIDTSLKDPGALDPAMREYQERRDEATLPMYGFTCDLARLEAPSPEQQALFAALASQPEHVERFFGVLAGTVPVTDFFSDENLGAIMSGAAVPT